QLDSEGRRAFVNLPDAGRISVVDLEQGRVAASWPLSERRANFPMAIDGTGMLIAVAFREPPTLALFDSRTGQLRATAASCADADDVFFDDKRHRLYLSCGSGDVETYASAGPAVLHRLADLRTSPGARTSLFVPELDRLFVAARGSIVGEEARILV